MIAALNQQMSFTMVIENLRNIKNDRLLKALRGEALDRPPIWLMRQAGRYLPEYLKIRAQAGSFMNLCRNADLASEVAMQPLRRFELDASILFSDILTIPDAMGLDLHFLEGEGPVFNKPIRTIKDIDRLPLPEVETELGYVLDVVRAMRAKIGRDLPIIGFSGSPWTLACYMLEGRGTRDFATARQWCWQAPETVQQLLEKLVDSCAGYLAAQVDAGADALMIFDTWGGLLSAAQYHQFSLQPMSRIIEKLRQNYQIKVPILLFSKGCHQQVPEMLATGANGLGIDWRADLSVAMQQAGNRAAIQGNLDPIVLLADAEQVKQQVSMQYGDVIDQPGLIVNLGHGIVPQTPPDNVAILVESVHLLSQ